MFFLLFLLSFGSFYPLSALGVASANDLSTQVPELVFTGSNTQWGISRNAQGEAVWYQYEGGYAQIFSNRRGLLAPAQRHQVFPQINNVGDVVWVEHSDGGSDDTIRGIIAGKAVLITSVPNSNVMLGGMSDTGEVVWVQSGGPEGARIYSSRRGLLRSFPGICYQPSINNPGDVIWQESPGNGTWQFL